MTVSLECILYVLVSGIIPEMTDVLVINWKNLSV